MQLADDGFSLASLAQQDSFNSSTSSYLQRAAVLPGTGKEGAVSQELASEVVDSAESSGQRPLEGESKVAEGVAEVIDAGGFHAQKKGVVVGDAQMAHGEDSDGDVQQSSRKFQNFKFVIIIFCALTNLMKPHSQQQASEELCNLSRCLHNYQHCKIIHPRMALVRSQR